eukprot:4298316-Pleurochrysis_carterae.AAC.1
MSSRHVRQSAAASSAGPASRRGLYVRSAQCLLTIVRVTEAHELHQRGKSVRDLRQKARDIARGDPRAGMARRHECLQELCARRTLHYQGDAVGTYGSIPVSVSILRGYMRRCHAPSYAGFDDVKATLCRSQFLQVGDLQVRRRACDPPADDSRRARRRVLCERCCV